MTEDNTGMVHTQAGDTIPDALIQVATEVRHGE
jgi:hypothetical protein